MAIQNMPRPIGADVWGLLLRVLELHPPAEKWHRCHMYDGRRPWSNPDDMGPQDDTPKLCNSSDPPDSGSLESCAITSQASSTTVARYCPLWAYHSLTVLFLGTQEHPSGSPILGVLWPPSRLTSEFLQNPKPVSSQKASC
ncbi:hypothetical protein ACFX15_036088 [Malus domestica]